MNHATNITAAHDDAMTAMWLAQHIQAGRMKVFGDAVTVTPAIAAALLANNPGNRRVVKSALNRWKNALRTGAWQLNGETIKVAKTGELNDGQHRLRAIVETGIAAPMVIVWGLDRDSRTTVDAGVKRQAGHVLGMFGVPRAHLTSAAIKVVLNYKAGVAITAHVENDEVVAAYHAMPGIAASVHYGDKVARTFVGTSGGVAAAMHYLMHERHPTAADAFFNLVIDGTGTSPSDPALRLRQRLIGNMASKAKLPPIEVAALMIKAFNHYVRGRQLGILRWRTEGDKAEDFPAII